MELDETKDAQDKSSGQTKETSGEEPETFTKEEKEEAVRKAKSDALSEVGRLKKANEVAIKAAERANARVEQIIKDQEDAELKAAAGDEERTSAVKERQLRRQAESKLVETERERDEKDEELKTANEEKAEATKERKAREIASRLGVSEKLLVTLAKSTDGSTEAIEDIAKELPKKGETQTLRVDSGKTIGGGKTITKKMLETMSVDEYKERQKEIDAAYLAGQIK